MDCPTCKTAMTRGSFVFDHAVSWILDPGMLYWDLYFKSTEKERVRVLENGFERQGFYCASCGAVFIEPAQFEKVDPTKCGQCGISLRPNHTGCHWCGWKPVSSENPQ